MGPVITHPDIYQVSLPEPGFNLAIGRHSNSLVVMEQRHVMLYVLYNHINETLSRGFHTNA